MAPHPSSICSRTALTCTLRFFLTANIVLKNIQSHWCHGYQVLKLVPMVGPVQGCEGEAGATLFLFSKMLATCDTILCRVLCFQHIGGLKLDLWSHTCSSCQQLFSLHPPLAHYPLLGSEVLNGERLSSGCPQWHSPQSNYKNTRVWITHSLSTQIEASYK